MESHELDSDCTGWKVAQSETAGNVPFFKSNNEVPLRLSFGPVYALINRIVFRRMSNIYNKTKIVVFSF